MEKLVLDTNVYVHAIRDAGARAALAEWQRARAPHIHQHAVVAAELLVGARDEETWRRWHERWIAPSERVGRMIVPSYAAWLRASRIVARLAEGGAFRAGPSFFNDCLLAATAREEGHRIVTYNTADFERIAAVEPAAMPVAPFP